MTVVLIQDQRRENHKKKLVVKNNLKKEQDKYRHIIKIRFELFLIGFIHCGKKLAIHTFVVAVFNKTKKKQNCNLEINYIASKYFLNTFCRLSIGG